MKKKKSKSLSKDQIAALAEIDALVAHRKSISKRLKDAKSRTKDKGDLRSIKSALTNISLKNLETVNARNRIRRQSSLGAVIGKLESLKVEAEQADEDLKELGAILAQATTIVNILGRIASIFA